MNYWSVGMEILQPPTAEGQEQLHVNVGLVRSAENKADVLTCIPKKGLRKPPMARTLAAVADLAYGCNKRSRRSTGGIISGFPGCWNWHRCTWGMHKGSLSKWCDRVII